MNSITLRELARLILCIAICQSAGVIGSVFTASSVTTWYTTLVKPWFTPPGSIISAVWIALFALMGLSLFLIWRKGISGTERQNCPGCICSPAPGQCSLVLCLFWFAVSPGRSHSNCGPLASHTAMYHPVLVHQQRCGPASRSLHSLGELCCFSQLHHLEAQFMNVNIASAPTDSNISIAFDIKTVPATMQNRMIVLLLSSVMLLLAATAVRCRGFSGSCF